MDERIARLNTVRDARVFADSAKNRGREDLRLQALVRVAQLRAGESSFESPAHEAIAVALHAYEELQSAATGKTYRAHRTWPMFQRHGRLKAAERMVLNSKASKGYEVLKEAGLLDLSFEAIIVRFPDEFSSEALAASRARLEGVPMVNAISAPRDPEREGATVSDVVSARPRPDAEAKEFFEGFSDQGSWFLARWLPQYRKTIDAISAALRAGDLAPVFEQLWKRADNSISNAAQGILKYETVDVMRDELVQVVRDIEADGAPENFDRIVARFELWKSQNRTAKVPRLMIARAFAGIHPDLYHTTVDTASQRIAVGWFTEHTGFVPPSSGSWAHVAQALSAHLRVMEGLGDDPLARNMFPWFVVEQLRARNGSYKIPAGHYPRPSSTFADISAEKRYVSLRHNVIQAVLYKELVQAYGRECVWTEHPSGTGGSADALVRAKGGRCILYEIKVADTAAAVVRQAMGQLFEYAYRDGGLNPSELIVVGEPELDATSARFLETLRGRFGIPVSYLRVCIGDEVSGPGLGAANRT